MGYLIKIRIIGRTPATRHEGNNRPTAGPGMAPTNSPTSCAASTRCRKPPSIAPTTSFRRC